MAQLVAFAVDGDVKKLDSDEISIKSFTRAITSKVEEIPTIGGYVVRSSGPNPVPITFNCVYYPAGKVGSPRTRLINWYDPVLKGWEQHRGKVGQLFIGNIEFGRFLLTDFDYDHSKLVAGVVAGVAPRQVDIIIRFISADREVVGVEVIDVGAAEVVFGQLE